MVSIYSLTIVIRSVYRNYYDRFYPQIHVANCIKKEHYKVKIKKLLSEHGIKMSSRKKKFGAKEVDKKEFYSSKQVISLDSVDLN